MAAEVIPFVFPGVPGVRCAFQTRVGGVSPAPWDSANIGDNVGDDPVRVAANRQALRETLGLLLESAVRATTRGAVHLSVRRVPETADPGHLLFAHPDGRLPACAAGACERPACGGAACGLAGQPAEFPGSGG